MRETLAAAGLIATLSLAAAEARAESFETVTDGRAFVQLVAGKTLTLVRPFLMRNAVKLQVSPEGRITGTALTAPVTGQWQWQNGYFCREMAWGDDPIPANCQVVQVNGDRIRFIADQGQGDRADFALR
jgi:hypothetical protein